MTMYEPSRIVAPSATVPISNADSALAGESSARGADVWIPLGRRATRSPSAASRAGPISPAQV